MSALLDAVEDLIQKYEGRNKELEKHIKHLEESVTFKLSPRQCPCCERGLCSKGKQKGKLAHADDCTCTCDNEKLIPQDYDTRKKREAELKLRLELLEKCTCVNKAVLDSAMEEGSRHKKKIRHLEDSFQKKKNRSSIKDEISSIEYLQNVCKRSQNLEDNKISMTSHYQQSKRYDQKHPEIFRKSEENDKDLDTLMKHLENSEKTGYDMAILSKIEKLHNSQVEMKDKLNKLEQANAVLAEERELIQKQLGKVCCFLPENIKDKSVAGKLRSEADAMYKDRDQYLRNQYEQMMTGWTSRSLRPLMVNENLKAGIEASQYQRLQAATQYEPTQHENVWSSYMKEIAAEREMQLENSRIAADQVSIEEKPESIKIVDDNDIKKEQLDEDLQELEEILFDSSTDLLEILEEENLHKPVEERQKQISEESRFKETKKSQDLVSETPKDMNAEYEISTMGKLSSPPRKPSVEDSHLEKEIILEEKTHLSPARSPHQISPFSSRGRSSLSPSSSPQRTSLSKDGSFHVSSRSPERLTPHMSISPTLSPERVSSKLLQSSPLRTSLKLGELLAQPKHLSEQGRISLTTNDFSTPRRISPSLLKSDFPCVDPERYSRTSPMTANNGLETCRGPCMKWYEETYGPIKKLPSELPKPPMKDFLKLPDRLQKLKEPSTETVTISKALEKKFCIESCRKAYRKFGIPFDEPLPTGKVACPGPCDRFLSSSKEVLKQPQAEEKSNDESDLSSRFKAEEGDDVFMDIKTCGSCCKDIGPTVMNVLKKVEEISEMLAKRGCMKIKPQKGIITESSRRQSVDIDSPTHPKIPELPSFGSFDMDKRVSVHEVDFGVDDKCILESPKPPLSFTDSQINAAFEDPLSHISLGSKEQVFSKMFPDLSTATMKAKEKPYMKLEKADTGVLKSSDDQKKEHTPTLPLDDKSDIGCKLVCWDKEHSTQRPVPESISTLPPLSKCDVLCWDEKKKLLLPADEKLPAMSSFGSFDMNNRISADDVDFGKDEKCLLEHAKPSPDFTDSRLDAAFEDPLSHITLGSKEQVFSKMFPHITEVSKMEEKQKEVLKQPVKYASDKSDMNCKVVCWDEEIRYLKTDPPKVTTPPILSKCDLVCWDKERRKPVDIETPPKIDGDDLLSEKTSDLKCEALCWDSEVGKIPETSPEYMTVPSIKPCDLVCWDKNKRQILEDVDLSLEITSDDKMTNIEVDQTEHLRDRTSGASPKGNSEYEN